MLDLTRLLCVMLALVVLTGYVLWAMRDAAWRGKSPLLVVIAVVLFFPLGLIAWLLFRPPAISRVRY